MLKHHVSSAETSRHQGWNIRQQRWNIQLAMLNHTSEVLKHTSELLEHTSAVLNQTSARPKQASEKGETYVSKTETYVKGLWKTDRQSDRDCRQLGCQFISSAPTTLGAKGPIEIERRSMVGFPEAGMDFCANFFFFCTFFFKHFVVPMEMSPMGNSGRSPQGKPAAA